MFTKKRDNAILPTRATAESAGWDICYTGEDFTIYPGEITLVETGIGQAMPAGHFMKIYDRSSMAVKGIAVLAGVIDADYPGEIKVCLKHLGTMPLSVTNDMKIAQAIIMPYVKGVEEITIERTGGFGSTDA